MPQTEIHDLQSFRQAIAAHQAVMLFKHSPICPTSAAAHGEWRDFREQRPDVPTLFVDVIADRAVARGLAEECGVAHQSPQAILFRGGEPVWDESHHKLTCASLEQAWDRAGS